MHPNSTWPVTSRHDTTRHAIYSSCILTQEKVVTCCVAHIGLHSATFTSRQARVVTWRDEPSGIWAIRSPIAYWTCTAELDMGPVLLTQSNPIHKYLILNRTRKLHAN